MNWKFWRRNKGNNPPMVNEESLDLLLRSFFGADVMDPQKAMNVAAYSSAVEFVAGVVGSLPIRLFELDGEGVNELQDDRRVTLLNRASGDLVRSHEMMRLFVMDYFNERGGFIYVERLGNEFHSLHYVDPRVVSVQIDSTDHIHKTAIFMVDGRKYYPWQFIYACRNSRNGVVGRSLIEQSGAVLDTAYKTQIFEEALMARGGNRRGYLQTEQKVDKAVIEDLKNAMRKMYTGENTDNIVVLNSGIKFQEASETSQEMQLAENKERQRNDVMSLFHIPPSLIEGGTSTDDHKKFVNYGLLPLLAVIEDALNDALLLESEKETHYFRFDIKELTKADLKDRWTAWATAKKNGLVNADEFRRFEDMEPLGMDYINLGLQDVLMDPKTKQIIVPNMATVIDPENLDPARAPRNPNEPATNTGGGEQNGDQNQQ